ncbi:MAG: hypothetical protein SNJ54_09710 [Anaerolineae bacterium]
MMQPLEDRRDGPHPADLAALLGAMQRAAGMLRSADLAQAQRPIAQHVHKLTGLISDALDGLPDLPHALQAALPTLGEDFPRHLETIQHYARLLIESPASFGGAALPPEALPATEALYAASRALRDHCEALRQQTIQERLHARRGAPEAFDWNAHLQNEAPLLRYLLRQRPIQLEFTPHAAPLMIFARRYHTTELVRHIVLTLGTELMAYGRIQLRLQPEAACHALRIYATGLQFTPSETAALFSRHGRHLYREQLDVDAGYLTFERQAGVGSSIIVHLPQATAE